MYIEIPLEEREDVTKVYFDGELYAILIPGKRTAHGTLGSREEE